MRPRSPSKPSPVRHDNVVIAPCVTERLVQNFEPMSSLGECGVAAKSAGAPALLQEWAPIFDKVDLANCLTFCSSHEGLSETPPSASGLKTAVNTLRIWMVANAAEAAGMTALEDPYSVDADAAKTAARSRAMAAMHYFHALAYN